MHPIPAQTVTRMARPEAMADMPGICEIELTRAVVQYRDAHEVDVPGGRIQDLGLAVVLDGRFASAAEVIDLGSADVKTLDLSGELVVVDWVYEPTLDHLNDLVRKAAAGDRAGLSSFCSRLAVGVLDRAGFGPLTRATLLRVGFRDVCRDLDLHEGTSVRIVAGPGRIVRAHLDYDAGALVFRTATSARDTGLESALVAAFPLGSLHRIVPGSDAASGGYQVRFGVPLSLSELRGLVDGIRAGFLRLLARFEPDRMSGVAPLVGALGHRDTLAQLRDRAPVEPTEPVGAGVGAAGSSGAAQATVH